MGTLIQNEILEGSYVPYERPPQAQTLWSAIPRGLQSFVAANATLDAKGAGDIMLLNLKATLPPNFAYVLADIHCAIAQDEADDWDTVGTLNLQNYYRAPQSVAMSSTFMFGFEVGTFLNTTRVMTNSERSSKLPAFPIIGTPGTSGALINVLLGNGSGNATTAGAVNAFISFWQFDLEQVRKFPINTPIPVSSR